MRSRPNPLYGLLKKSYYETAESYVPRKTDFYNVISSQLPAHWRLFRKGIWFCCSPPLDNTPQQGWKIHISATAANADEILSRISIVLFGIRRAAFKFAADRSILLLLNSKNWPRGGACKFMTIYPKDNHDFLMLLEQVRAATSGLCGPYILSDQRYEDSKTVFYRFGGMRLREVLNIKGERVPMLSAPDGTLVPDERLAYPTLPEWVTDPVQKREFHEGSDGNTLKCGRYVVEDALAFSSAGGVYKATDQQTGRTVVIKEARPHINANSDGHDAVTFLKKEHRLLTMLEDAGIAPRPVDLFQEWEHWFLVEEYIDGICMASHAAEHNILLRTRPAPADYEQWYQTFRALCISLAAILEILHSRNIIFADLSTTNLIVTACKTELKLIDFEGAYEVGVDRPGTLYTPGFASEKRLAGCDAAFEDDYYSAGAVLMAYLFPLNGLFHLKPRYKQQLMRSIQRDTRLPREAAEAILAMMHPDPSRRAGSPTLMTVMKEHPYIGEAECPDVEKPEFETIVRGIVEHIESACSYHRIDMLAPGDPSIFTTNPLGLAHGAAGIGYALKELTGRQPQKISDWILRQPIHSENCPPGMYVGMSGIAWSMLEMGGLPDAEKIFSLTFSHRLLHSSPDLFYGTAGWGMANLRLFLATGNELYLDGAKQAASMLLATRRECSAGCYWGQSEDVQVGLAHGASGIALFLLYLYLATQDEESLAIGQQALAFDLAHAVFTPDGGLSWPPTTYNRRALYPYWRFGSSGIGLVVLRYYKLLQDAGYLSVLEQTFIDTDRKYAVLPGRFMGLAGLGEFMLDLYQLTGEQRHLKAIDKIARGIAHFSIPRRGIAFPGNSLSHVCCDYGTGSAGIALFLSRMLGRHKSDFMLDDLFNAVPQVQQESRTLSPSPQKYQAAA